MVDQTPGKENLRTRKAWDQLTSDCLCLAESAEPQRDVFMHENDISKVVLNLCLKIHKELGPGLFESVYENILSYELHKAGLPFETQVEVPVKYDGKLFEKGFRADIIVADKVLIELKSVEKISNVHKKQVLTYLKLTGIKLGLLINFNEKLMKYGFTRVVNNLEEEA